MPPSNAHHLSPPQPAVDGVDDRAEPASSWLRPVWWKRFTWSGEADWGAAPRIPGLTEVPGTAIVYPTVLAAAGYVAHPAWRASSVGVYGLWRDGGFAVGALLAGIVADLLGLAAAIRPVAALTAASGLVVALPMCETHTRDEPRPAVHHS